VYPYSSFIFYVEIKGINVAQFSEVNGLQIEIETEPYREGGKNDFIYNFPKGIKYQPLVLKRGITDIDELWNWYKDVMKGKIERKDVTIRMYRSYKDMKDNEAKWRSWTFEKAYPIKWTGPALKADSNTIAFESIELVHQGIIDSK
jgi:phage tail-like protein